MDAHEECLVYIKRWYLGEPVLAIRQAMDDNDEQVIQYLVVELLRDLIDNPVPNGMLEGSVAFNAWVDAAYRKITDGVTTGFRVPEESAVKNLAWTYLTLGITRTQKKPEMADRLYKCMRQRTVN